MTGALAGLRVIDCSRLIAGGVLATVLADHGADVVKVENPRAGDPLRTWLRERGELWWKVYARGKRSITLNLTDPCGQALLRRLARDADVLVENYVPGTFERWGLGWDVLSRDNPRLVFARVSGWGQDGPYRERPGFGTMVEAMSGFAHTTGEPDGPPTLPSFPMADMVAALAGCAAVLAALRHRDQVSGRGQVVDISLYEPLLSVLGPDAAAHALDGTVRERRGNTSDNASPRGTYRTRDGKWVALSASTPASAKALFTALGLGPLLEDPRFATNDARVRHGALVDAALAEAIGARTLDDMRGLFESSDLTACPVYDIDEVYGALGIPAAELERLRRDGVV
jgi:crotonobetainyl-CoA:carnitine CoA-transferase CaiB-like acyl-CoA transferase